MNLFSLFRGASAAFPLRAFPSSFVAVLAMAVLAAPARAGDPVAVGANVTFYATADGSPAPTFQWRKNGAPISGATGQTFVIAAASLGDAGTYSVIATNNLGSATSPDEVLVVQEVAGPVNTAPVITTQPAASQSVVAGGTATFTVVATGSPAPTYQWRKYNDPISGATSATFSLSAVSSSDAGQYSVVVTNVAGSVTSAVSTLTVTESGTGSGTGGSGTGGGGTSGGGTGGTPSGGGTGTGSGGSTDTAPTILVQPVASQVLSVGASASLSVSATGSPAPTYQWRKDGASIAGANGSTYSIASLTSAHAGVYSVVVTNSVSSIVSNGSALEVVNSVSGSKPIITTQPESQFVADGATARFTVGVSAVPGASYQWRKNGKNIPGATTAALTFPSVSIADVGTYTVVATNTAGATTSTGADLVIAGPPVITRQPLSQAVYSKSNVTLSVAALGSPAPGYQWRKNGVAIAGATGATLALKSVTKSDAGKYTVQVTNSIGWVVSSTATLMVENQTGRREDDVSSNDTGSGTGSTDAVNASQLVNLSVRANAGSGGDGLIVGFVVESPANKQVLIRGVGPALRDFGVIGALADPSLALYSGANLTAANDDWITNENALLIEGTSLRVGAFGLGERGADSALMTTLRSGAYTAQVTSKDASTGVALVEVYDTAASASSRLVNLSVRSQVGGTAEAPNVGFVIAGTTPKRVLIRAVGPTLQAFGVTDAIGDPQLEVYRGSTLVEQNDNWGGGEVYNAIFTRVGAFGFANPESRDAVLFTVLDPGAYTVVVSGVNGSSGVGLVELYEVP